MKQPAGEVTLDHRPLIVTALAQASVQGRLEALRQTHFPAERNQVPAHVTLFHALPGSMADDVLRRLKAVCGPLPPPRAEMPHLRFMGRGVAMAVHSPELSAIRDELAHGWHGLLTLQDAQGWRPHVTIQNKVTGAQARATFERLSATFQPITTQFCALALWRYCGGPWQPVARVGFRGS
ncbi:2'-5' RNA ligase family protein [Sandarakinorhabdus sp.]|uniref:2'-5' RNA ligase family protein n=1 Tax=Sandarakinorhabdus sp. TaxID=1916663 RepID=UPI00286E8A4B|nr:2'-5' RNA ligase family protein [Sandarakinorhabdus sp.]